VFDSRKEAKRYQELILLQRVGIISDLKRQVKYELLPAQYEAVERYGKNGKRLKDEKRLLEKAVYYIADFVYEDEDGNTVVEDTKGVKTKDYIIKRKMMLFFKKIKIREV
jgi:hypothetical protein